MLKNCVIGCVLLCLMPFQLCVTGVFLGSEMPPFGVY